MGDIKDGFASTFRPFKIDGVPASGANKVSKSEAAALGRAIETQIAFAAGAVSGDGIEAIVAAVQPLVNDAEAASEQAGEYAAAAEASIDGASVSAQIIDLRGGTMSAGQANGATFIQRAGIIVGLSIANGTTGQSAFLNVVRVTGIEPAGVAGLRTRVDLSFAVSAGFDRTLALDVYTFDASQNVTTLSYIGEIQSRIENGTLTLSGIYDFPSNAVGMQLTARLTGTAATTGVQTMELIAAALRPVVPAGGVTRADVALSARDRQLFATVKSDQRVYSRQILVTAPGEGGEFTSIKAAIAAAQPQAGPSSRALIRIAPKSGGAAYAERQISGDYIDLISAAPGTHVLIDGGQANNASPTDITVNSTFDAIYDMRMEWIEARMTNGRYVVHWDYAGSTGKLWETRNCIFWHRGNEGARQYQISQGHDPDTFGTPYYIWKGVSAIGAGIWDDCHAAHYDTVFWAPDNTVSYHDQYAGPFGRRGSTLLFDGCEIEAGVTVNPSNGAVTRASQSGGDPVDVVAIQLGTYGQPATSLVTLRNNPVIFGRTDVVPIGFPAATRSRWVLDGEGNAPLNIETYNPILGAGFTGGAAAVSRVL